MSHPEQIEYVTSVRSLFPNYFSAQRVLEIGSRDHNGTVRTFFESCKYTGLDLTPGPGVDVVCGGQDFAGPDNVFDVVISCEAMEHNPHWVATFKNMIRLCRPGGLVLMTCATRGRPEHGTSRSLPADSVPSLAIGWDYYRNLDADDFRASIDLPAQFARHAFFYNYNNSDLYFIGIKHTADATLELQRVDHALRDLKLQYLKTNVAHWPAFKRMLLLRCLGEDRFLRLKTLVQSVHSVLPH
ncbi:MAG: Synechococcus phage [Pseudomonadota bacterium]